MEILAFGAFTLFLGIMIGGFHNEGRENKSE